MPIRLYLFTLNPGRSFLPRGWNSASQPIRLPSPPSGPPQIRANLTFNSTPTDTSGGGVFVPDGIPVTFGISG